MAFSGEAAKLALVIRGKTHRFSYQRLSHGYFCPAAPDAVLFRNQISEWPQKIVFVQPCGVHDAAGARRGAEGFQPTVWIVEIVGIVVTASHGAKPQA